MTTQQKTKIKRWLLLSPFTLLLFPQQAQASLFHGETLDKVANGLSWIILFVVPVIGIVIFWLVHILPEKVAEKNNHPQAKAIQVLCLLSLFFGGLLWPLAWLWAYSKPVLYKMAYGKDTGDHHPGEEEKPAHPEDKEVQSLRAQVSELKQQLKNQSGGGQA